MPMRPPIRLTLYGKARCSLCDHARETVEDVIDDLWGQVEVTLVEVDITRDEALRQRYRHDVPVLVCEGRGGGEGEELFRHRVDADRLRARLLSATPCDTTSKVSGEPGAAP